MENSKIDKSLGTINLPQNDNVEVEVKKELGESGIKFGAPTLDVWERVKNRKRFFNDDLQLTLVFNADTDKEEHYNICINMLQSVLREYRSNRLKDFDLITP